MHRGDGTRGGGRRRAKNNRYRKNCRERSRLLVVSWNAEGLRSKVSELQQWLSLKKVDVVAIQEAQLPAKSISIPGYQEAAVTRRARGRRDGARAKGGEVAIYVRNGLSFDKLSSAPLAADDDVTKWCGVRVFGRGSNKYIDIHNLYRPPLLTDAIDERQDRFDPSALPADDRSLVVGDVNAHHPRWDGDCAGADGVGRLNGQPTVGHAEKRRGYVCQLPNGGPDGAGCCHV